MIWLIKHLCGLMSKQYPSEAQSLSDALNQVIVYNKANIPNAGGVSLFFLYKEKELLSELAIFYSSFNFASDYTGYIQKFVGLLQEGSTADWNMSKSITKQEGETDFFVQLTSEQVDTYASASYHVLINVKTEDELYGGDEEFNGYYIVFNSSDVKLEESGRLYANYGGKTQKLLEPETGETFVVIMREQEVTDSYVRYYVPVVLSKFEREPFSFEQAAVNIQLQTDRNGENVKMLSAIPISNDDNPFVAERKSIDIYEYTEAHFILGLREPTHNVDGSLKPFEQWESMGGLQGRYLI